MEQVLITSYNKEDLTDLIMYCLKKVLNDYPLANNQKEVKDELLSIADVQELFKVSKVTIHKWKKMGLIPYYKMNRKLYFKKSEILEAMSQKKRKIEL